jgi:hypothetical protein
MATKAKIVTIRRRGKRLSSDFRAFIDACIVPALVKAYLSEAEGAESYARKLLQAGRQREHTPAELSDVPSGGKRD